MKSKSLQWLFFALFILFFFWMVISDILIPKPIPRPPVMTKHEASELALWVRSDYSITEEIVAMGDKLFVIATVSTTDLPHLIALDSHTGNINWQNEDTDSNVLTLSETLLIVGKVGSVVAFNPDDGSIIWSTKLPFTRSVTKVLVREKILYVDTVSNNHFLLDAELGTILQSIAYTVDNAPNPDIPIWSDHNMNLQFVGNTMYFQKHIGYPNYEGDITAINEFSNDQIWNSGSLYAPCRIAVSPVGIFVLDLNGKLLKFEPTSGLKEDEIQFHPSLALSSESENDGSWVYEYYVAVDTDNQLLFVYLGDSNQLFAFHLPVSP